MLTAPANPEAASPPDFSAETGRFPGGALVSVLLPLPLEEAFDYRLPPDMPAALGDIVLVPFSRREVLGILWGAGHGTLAPEKIKPVLERRAIPPLPQSVRDLVSWVSRYAMAPLGLVLKMALSVPEALQPPAPPLPRYRPAEPLPAGLKLTPPRRAVLEAARTDGDALPLAELTRLAGCSDAVARGLVAAGALLPQPADPAGDAATLPQPDPHQAGPLLSDGQETAAASLRAAVGAGFSVTLLDGVTGSGKTEVYFEAVATALQRGEQVLVLLPEIALSAQWLERFTRRFGTPPLVWHSDLGLTVRRRGWQAVARGRVPVVVGARSALFLPFTRLGLIIVDEEHDSSFKQEEGVFYHARDMAVVRAQQGGIPLLLASATPSLETQANVRAGRYRCVKLPSRHGGAVLPETALIDLRRHPPARNFWLAPPLEQAVRQTLEAGEQSLLFLNRRGYAPLTLCRGCGHRLQCPNCTAWLVEHRSTGRLHCHHCGTTMPRPTHCPACEAEDKFAACGPGVERLAEEVAQKFPGARLGLMASDLLNGPLAAADLVERMARHEIDIMIGTQIVAKGHHFPLLTLVGVVDADLGLAGGDLRAAERTFQMLSQVSGRAGRAERRGRVLLQTCQPEEKVMQALAAGDADSFYAAESDAREALGFPPFGRLAALIVSGEDAGQVDQIAARLGRQAPHGDGIEVFGPAPAPLALLRGRHRRRLLLKTPRRLLPQGLIRAWLSRVDIPSAVRVQIDIDPYSFM